MDDPGLEGLARARWRVAAGLSTVMVGLYFGFLGLVAWGRDLLAIQLLPGLTLGIVLGALVIVTSWLLTWAYVRWCSRYYDGEVARLSDS